MKLKAIDFTIPQTATSLTQEVNLPKGYNIIGAMFKKFSGDDDKKVKLEVQYASGSVMIDPISIDFYNKSTDGFKPETALPFPPKTTTDSAIVLRFTTETLTQDFKGEMLFILEEGHSNVGGKIVPDSEVTCKY